MKRHLGAGGNPRNLRLLKDGISWKSDREKKFSTSTFPNTITTSPFTGEDLSDVEDEDLIVWMRTAALPNFRKLYRRIEGTTLFAGDMLEFNISNVYNVHPFDGEKYLVLSTTSSLGGKNEFIGISYIMFGIVSWLFSGVFFAKTKISGRRLGDMSYLNWAAATSTSDHVKESSSFAMPQRI